MRIDDLIRTNKTNEEFRLISERCSQFLEDAGSLPLLKNLPQEYNDFHKVKVRKRKKLKEDTEGFAHTFNGAFEAELHSLRERAVFANGPASFEPADMPSLDPFYIFPIDGYRFMYSKEVENSSQDYKTVFDAIFEEFGTERGNEVLVELLKFSYTSTNLHEGIEQGSEIIIYNIPYFYAIRTTSVEDYSVLLTNIKDLK